MRVAIFSESAADEAAVRVLIEALLGAKSETVELGRFRARRGWTNVRGQLGALIKYLYYRTDAEALVAVVDSNGSALHASGAAASEACADDCRLCQLRTLRDRVIATLPPVAGRTALRVGLGIAAPAIEAWYLCDRSPTATEVAWARDLATGAPAPAFVRKLKEAVYGTDRPSIARETHRAVEEATRLAADIGQLELQFPIGFGALAADVRAWRG